MRPRGGGRCAPPRGRGRRVLLVASVIALAGGVVAPDTLTQYQRFVLGKYLSCPSYASEPPLVYTGSNGESCCTEEQVRSFIFRPPLLDFQNAPDKIIALAAAEGVVYALTDGANDGSNSGGPAATDPFLQLLNCSNITGLPPELLAKWVPPGVNPVAWCENERHNLTRALAYNAALAASDGNREDAELGAAFADQQYNNTHGQQSCSIPYLIPTLAEGTGCAGGQFINRTSNKTAPCLPGYFCPITLPCLIRCTSGAFCNLSHIDASNWREEPCPEKSFCPHAVRRVECPSGHFCPEATEYPSRCNEFMVCPPGTGKPSINFTGLAVVGFMSFFMLIGMVVYKNRSCTKRVYAWWLGPKNAHLRRRVRPTAVHELVKLKLFRMSRPGSRVRHLEADYMLHRRRTSTSSFDSDDVALLGTGLVEPKSYSLTVEYKNLHMTVRQTGKVVLQACSGALRAGKVTAIMGPSGAGKSSFIGAITGAASTYGVITGEMKVNGVRRTLSEFRDVCGFVPQDDIMHTDLKVREVLYYQAQLRLPDAWPTHKKVEIVAYVIKLLGLEDVVDSIIGNPEVRGISGGQRKRVNIGMELVADPTFLALDEPTSGLDSTSSLKVVAALKAVAIDQNLTVAAVIHQPRYEIFAAFDELLLLGRGGYTAYFGPTDEACHYFEDLGFSRPPNMNPADFIMDVLGGEIPHVEGKTMDFRASWEAHTTMSRAVMASRAESRASRQIDNVAGIQASDFGGSGSGSGGDDDDDDDEAGRCTSRIYNDLAFSRRKMPSYRAQVWTCFKRRLVQFRRAAGTHALDLLLVAFGGAVLGGTYLNAEWKKYPQMATYSSLIIGMNSMLFSLRYFGEDTDVIRRETSSGMGIVPFFIAGNLVQLPVVAVLPMVYLAVVFPMLSPLSSMSMQYSIYLACTWCCTGLGFLLSTLFQRSSAQVVAVVLALTSAMFAGTSPSIPTMDRAGAGMVIAYDSSYGRWLVEAITTAEMTHVPVLYHLEVQGELSYLGYEGPDVHNTRIVFCCGMLFVMGLLARVGACYALWFTYVRTQPK